MAKTAPPVAEKMIGGGLQMTSSGEQRRQGKKHVSAIHTKRAKGGGHVVTHHYEHGSGGYHEPVDHVFGKDEGEKHVKHYIRHAGITGVKVSAGEPSGADDAGEGGKKKPSDNDGDE